MYILYTGFSVEEQKVIESWSKNISSELSEGFSVGNSLQIGRLVEINFEYLKQNQTTIQEIIENARALRTDFEDYLPYIIETRFFYNKELDCIFATGITDKDGILTVKITRIPFVIFFKMADNSCLKAYLGYEEEGEIIPDEEIELVEIGFLSRYLVCHFVDKTGVFLIEGKDIKEFQKITRFIAKLGNRIGWKWYKRQENDNELNQNENE